MQAIVQDAYGSADVLELREIDTPEIGKKDVLVRVHAAGVDQGVWHLMAGLPYLIRLGFGFRRPRTLVRGSDCAGRVEAVGPEVTRFQPGDEVFGTCDGAYAELASAREENLAPKPASLTFEQAAAIPTSGATALQGLRGSAEVQSGQRILIIGASGGVGSFAVQIAKALGAEVTGVCSTQKTDLVRSLGADHTIDYTQEDITDRGVRYDAILDIGGNRRLSLLRRALAPRGTLVILGGEGGGRWFGGVDRQLRALIWFSFVRQRFRSPICFARRDALEALGSFIEAGQLMPSIDRTYPLEEVPRAIRHMTEGRARGKVVVTVTGNH